MPHIKNINMLFIISCQSWLFVFFCVLGPCLRGRYICYGDNSSKSTLRKNTSFHKTFEETEV